MVTNCFRLFIRRFVRYLFHSMRLFWLGLCVRTPTRSGDDASRRCVLGRERAAVHDERSVARDIATLVKSYSNAARARHLYHPVRGGIMVTATPWQRVQVEAKLALQVTPPPHTHTPLPTYLLLISF